MENNEIESDEFMGFSIVHSEHSKMTIQKLKDIMYNEGKELIDLVKRIFFCIFILKQKWGK